MDLAKSICLKLNLRNHRLKNIYLTPMKPQKSQVEEHRILLQWNLINHKWIQILDLSCKKKDPDPVYNISSVTKTNSSFFSMFFCLFILCLTKLWNMFVYVMNTNLWNIFVYVMNTNLWNMFVYIMNTNLWNVLSCCSFNQCYQFIILEYSSLVFQSSILIHSSIHSFIHSFIHSSSFIHSLIHPLIHSHSSIHHMSYLGYY